MTTRPLNFWYADGVRPKDAEYASLLLEATILFDQSFERPVDRSRTPRPLRRLGRKKPRTKKVRCKHPGEPTPCKNADKGCRRMAHCRGFCGSCFYYEKRKKPNKRKREKASEARYGKSQ